MDKVSELAIGSGALALVVAVALYFKVKSAPEGNDQMKIIAGRIREGAMAFLKREYQVLAAYAAVVFGLLAWQLDITSAGAFAAGAFLSLLAGFFGMKAATYGNAQDLRGRPRRRARPRPWSWPSTAAP